MRTLEYSIPTEYEGSKVLHFLKRHAGLSSRVIRNLKFHDDGILCNGAPIRTIDYIHTGDVLTVNLPDDSPAIDPDLRPRRQGFHPSEPVPEPRILYEDEDLVVVDKPAGLAVHQSHNHQGDTLADWLADHYGGPFVFRAVGRLDKGTSGIVVCARNKFAASPLQGKVKKTYYALVNGAYEGSGTIDAPIFRPDPKKTTRSVDPRGVPAVTHWKALRTDGSISFLEIHLETGRTHQIRVHFASQGTPLLGDVMYGAPERDDIHRHALHCGRAEFIHPYTRSIIRVEADLPEDMVQIARLLHKI